jgi:hypothetical protein
MSADRGKPSRPGGRQSGPFPHQAVAGLHSKKSLSSRWNSRKQRPPTKKGICSSSWASHSRPQEIAVSLGEVSCHRTGGGGGSGLNTRPWRKQNTRWRQPIGREKAVGTLLMKAPLNATKHEALKNRKGGHELGGHYNLIHIACSTAWGIGGSHAW